jgi:cytochrome c peroxidase
MHLSKTRILTPILGLVLILGLPPVLMLTGDPPPDEVPPPEPASPLKALVARQSNLALLYDDWQERYLTAGGDRRVVVGLGWARGLSTEPSSASGRAEIDMVGGTVKVSVDYLDAAADAWLVDNQPGAGRSALPEPGDHLRHIGRLLPRGDGSPVTATAALGAGFFRDFELDLVVVSRAGSTPADNRLLVGSRPYFERLHTRTRLAAERRREARVPVGPARLLELISPQPAFANSTQILIAHNLVGQAVGDGADLFFRETFAGNGRTCGTCHSVARNQAIDPEFIDTLPPDDPLFVAVLPGGVPGLERETLLEDFGLILENLDGLEDPTVKFVLRGVPHSLSMATSILAPNDGRPEAERTGWSGDGGSGGELRTFPVGAINQHFTKSLDRVANVDFRPATDEELDDMEAFMLAVGRLGDLDLSTVSLSDSRAASGLSIFTNDSLGKCNRCHTNAGAMTGTAGNRNFNTGVERLDNPARAVEDFPFDGGHGKTEPFDSDGDGEPDSFGDGTFNVAPLVEAADTGPFFHNNAVTTIEAAVKFYSTTEFNESPAADVVGPIDLTVEQSEDVAAFLRVINAGFNIDIALQRTAAAESLENSSSTPTCTGKFCPQGQPAPEVNGTRATVDALLALANIEAADAVEDLNDVGLNASAVSKLVQAIDLIADAIDENASNRRKQLMQQAEDKLAQAKADLGSGLDPLMGEGNLLF